MRTIIKVVNKNYRTQKDLENLVGYVLRIKPSDRHRCSCGSFCARTITAYEEMVKVQNYYGKTEDRLARHFSLYQHLKCIRIMALHKSVFPAD